MTAISSAVRSLGGDFPAEAFGRTYRLWSRVGDFSDLFTWDDLNQIIARHRLEPPRLRLFNDGSQIPHHSYAHPVVSKRHTVWHRIEPAGLHHQLKDGASLVLDAVDALHPGAEDLATALERHFRTDVQVNLYASWTPQEGFGVHWDDHDVVVVQLEGAKRWKLYGATRIDPLRVDTEAPEPPTGAPVAEIVLQAGDMLYLPRGWWHAVAATEGRSLHLTCGLKPTTGADLLSWLSDQLRVSDTVRANLPYFASPDERTTYLQALRKEFTDALHEGVIEEFINARGSADPGRPIPSLPFVDGIPADGSLCVRLTAAGAWYGVDEDGHVVFSAGGQEWTFSSPVLAVIKLLLAGSTATLGELSVSSGLPVGHVAALISELVEAGAAAVSWRR
ncbi:cupin domain-containing protein [Streptomyces auratus]|uniref:Cupin-like domain-containing protein n=1 Tax=Streptomyces auratus AGR0001 TaxID=1160718 RepID=J1ZW83_9ACTN|nr:cupin domain-containing protein [Streptomyces auratus]QTZ92760.1 cupin-like domain-containing protein [Streptomyces auratus AGR0001]